MALTDAPYKGTLDIAACTQAVPANREDATTAAKTLCIFTPTYNRAYCIGELFESLKAQTCFDFMWLVVDDGSTDETESIIRTFQNENCPFTIEYIKQENGGKARAHNTGVAYCQNELFFCVDSDDHLTPNCIEMVCATWQKAKADPAIAGIIAMDGKDPSTPLTKLFPEGLFRSTRWDLFHKYGHSGDVASIYRTELLRQFPFEVADGEKFMAETFVYYQIDQHYEMLIVHEILEVIRYREDGYTSNVRTVTRQNPRSYALHKKRLIEYSDTMSLKFKNTALYLVGCILGKVEHGIRDAPSPFLACLAYLPAQLLCATVYRKRD